MTGRKTLLAVAAALLLVFAAGCGSLSDIYGNNGSNNQNYPSDIRGTVSSVDTSSRSIWLTNTSGYNNMLSSGGSGGDVRIYYDNNTRVTYNGRSYRPEDLDRGDQVDVRVTQSNNRLYADTVDVTYNSTTASSTSPNPYPNGTYNQSITGTVRSVDTSRRQIEIDRGYGSTTWVNYDTSTSVLFNGRTYSPQDLERGDQVSITATDTGGGRLFANNITVTRSVSGASGTSGTASNYATVRGTVRYVDTSSRTIELEQTSWMSGFTGDTSGSNIMVVQYDTNTQVDVSGRLYPVSGLERGDVVDVQVSSLGNANWLANRITLVRNVRQ